MRAALIECGNIGTALAELIKMQREIRLFALVDGNIYSAQELRRKLKINHPRVMEMEEAIKKSDLVIEAASPGAVKKF